MKKSRDLLSDAFFGHAVSALRVVACALAYPARPAMSVKITSSAMDIVLNLVSIISSFFGVMRWIIKWPQFLFSPLVLAIKVQILFGAAF
jgi:hypothetical protein